MYHSSRPPATFLRFVIAGFFAYIFFSGIVSVFGSTAVVIPILAVPFLLVIAKIAMVVLVFRGFRRLAGAPAAFGWDRGRYVTVERDRFGDGSWRRRPSRRPPARRPAPVDPDWERAKREAREELDREFPDPQAP